MDRHCGQMNTLYADVGDHEQIAITKDLFLLIIQDQAPAMMFFFRKMGCDASESWLATANHGTPRRKQRDSFAHRLNFVPWEPHENGTTAGIEMLNSQ